MLGDAGTLWAQGYSWYDSKKSGGLTISYLRLADAPIVAPYLIEGADYVACHKDIYVKRGYPMATRLCDGGIFVLNTAWKGNELAQNLPPAFKASLVQKHAKFYCIDAAAIAAKVGLGARINMIMEVAYLYLAQPIPFEQALEMLKDAVRTMYASKGDDVVAKNLSAIQEAVTVLAHANCAEGDGSLWGESAEGASVTCGSEPPHGGSTRASAARICNPTDSIANSLAPANVFAPHEEAPTSVSNPQLGSVSEAEGVEGGSEHILISAGSACACISRDVTERLRDSSRSDVSRTAEGTASAPYSPSWRMKRPPPSPY
jgi:pyruvate-ferredoxin/flavodoxin oxidoreductase